MRSRLLSAWSKISAKHPVPIIIGAILVTAVAVFLSKDLGMSMHWSDLLPENDPQVKEFEKILENYSSAANTIVVLSGPEREIKQAIEEIADQIEALEEDVKRVVYKQDSDFIRNHGLMLIKEKNLKEMTSLFQDLDLAHLITRLNDNFEKIYTGDEESLSNKRKETEAVAYLDGIEYFLETMKLYAESGGEGLQNRASEAAERFLMGDQYFISPDKNMMFMIVEPTYSVDEIERCVENVNRMESIVKSTIAKYPRVTGGLTGMLPLQRDEMVYSMRDMQRSSLLALTLILILFIVAFRMISSPILAGLNLVMAIIWTAGLTRLLVSDLNMMTSMFAVILIGLGIDFSIHIISIYHELRKAGEDISNAVKHTLLKSGGGIITGGLTTAAAFLTIMVSETRGMKEMGLVLGCGIIICMLGTILVFPSILVLREKVMMKLRKRTYKPVSVEFAFLRRIGESIQRYPYRYLVIGLAITGVFLYQALHIKFDYNLLNMEPKGLESVVLQDSLIEAFDMCPDFVMITSKDIRRIREITEEARDLQSVGMVSSISDYIPSFEEQKNRRPYLLRIRDYLNEKQDGNDISPQEFDTLIAQLERLDMNIYELGQMAFLGGQDRVDRKCKNIVGDPEKADSKSKILQLAEYLRENGSIAIKGLNRFQKHYQPTMRELAYNMANPAQIKIETIPADIKRRFFDKSGEHMLVTIFPTEHIWNFEFMKRFIAQMRRIDPGITGMPPLTLRLINYYERDGKVATILTLVIVFILLLIDFRSVWMALMGMVPLVCGAIWMVGIMESLGMMITYVNIMAIPMIVGIGIDDGVHILHRYRIEGDGHIPDVLASTGKAVLLTSLTTMCGFGSLMIAEYRGFSSMGSLLMIGVGACFLTTVLILGSLLCIHRKKKSGI